MYPNFLRHRIRQVWVVLAVTYSLVLTSPASAGWDMLTTRDGLPNDFVHAIAEDRNGNFWFGTNGGVCRYDGATCQTFTTADGLVENTVSCLFVDRSGILWAGSFYGGVSRYDGTTWQSFTTANGLGHGGVPSIMQDSAGNLWFGNDEGVTRYDGHTWRTFTRADGLGSENVSSSIQDRAGNLWFVGYGGVSRYDGSTWRTFTTADGLVYDVVREVGEDRAGNLWFSTREGLSRYDGSTWQTYLAGISCGPILADRNGNMWFNSVVVHRYDGTNWSRFTFLDGLPPLGRPIMEDTSGNIWFGSNRGACRFDQSTWKTFSRESLGYGQRIWEDRSGNLWFGAKRYDGSTWYLSTMADSLPYPLVSGAGDDRAGNYWFGSRIEGSDQYALSRYDGSTWRHFTTADGLPVNGIAVLDLMEDRAGNLWISTHGGVSRYDGSTWQTFTTTHGLPSNSVLTITEDRDGALWFGTLRGATHYDGTTWRTFTTADGLAGNAVYAIMEDRSGNLWFGSFPGGLSRYDGSSWQTFPQPGEGVLSMWEDREGRLWFGTYNGVARYDGSVWTTVTPADGLAHNIVGGVFEDRAGTLWFSTSNGVSRFEPDFIPPRSVLLKAPSRVSPSPDQVAALAALLGETKIEFSTRLDGDPWSEWSLTNSWFRTGLPDGPHMLEVRSRDMWNNVEQRPAVASFVIDATSPQPVLATPPFGQAVRGNVEVRGTTLDSRFSHCRIQVRESSASSWNPPDAVVLVQSSTPVAAGLLGFWETSSVPDGAYDLRVAVTDSLGLTGSAQVSIIVDNHAPFFDQTAPAKVVAEAGGDIYTTNSETHLYFPPHAFGQDVIVMVAPLEAGSVPPSPRDGVVKVLDGYELTWAGALRKPARFTLGYDRETLPPGNLAIYHSVNGSGWNRLGGTVDGTRKSISLAVTEPGRYALFADDGEGSGAASLSRIAFSPRVFSPTGGFADRQVGISFRLGRPAPVTVKVFSLSGRLIREVATGIPMSAGENLVRWDGTDRNGGYARDGVYLVTVEALGRTETKTLAIVR